MCGRYYIAEDDSAEELKHIIDEVNRRHTDTAAIKTVGEIFPTDTVPVIANNRNMEPAAFAMRWGYTMTDGKPVINARSETAASKVMFQDGMLQRHCLIPASNYFEWEKRGKERIKYAIQPTGSNILYMAGIYRIVAGIAEFTILTREPADSVAFIHNRMPVILPTNAQCKWLDVHCNVSSILSTAITDMEYQIA